jgi:hypothetical protein
MHWWRRRLIEDETNLYQEAYNLACKTFAVAPHRKVEHVPYEVIIFERKRVT